MINNINMGSLVKLNPESFGDNKIFVEGGCSLFYKNSVADNGIDCRRRFKIGSLY